MESGESLDLLKHHKLLILPNHHSTADVPLLMSIFTARMGLTNKVLLLIESKQSSPNSEKITTKNQNNITTNKTHVCVQMLQSHMLPTLACLKLAISGNSSLSNSSQNDILKFRTIEDILGKG